MKYLGKEMSRVEGIAKVTGRAKYAAEFELPNVAYGFLALSTIAKGTIETLDLGQAEKAPGVLKIFTHLNVPQIMPAPPKVKEGENEDTEFRALQDAQILFSAQPIALIVAESFEQARAASRLVKATYAEEKFVTDVRKVLDKAYDPAPKESPKERGDVQAALKKAPVTLSAEYFIPMEHHNPMEPHGAVAFWKDNKLTIFDKTQNVYQLRDRLAKFLRVPAEDVNVVSLFGGGAFGSSLAVNYYPPLVAMAARELKRPVELVYTRPQMFTGHGHRPETWQKVELGADKDGRLSAMSHHVIHETSTYQDYADNFVRVARLMYKCPNVETLYQIAKTDLPTPVPMRAPGAVSNMFALECALDELAYKLGIDPLELRLVNYAETDPDSGKPYSSKELRECYRVGAERFGWEKRKMEPRSMRDGRLLVGWGMATGLWPALQQPATAKITLRDDGTAHVASATTDIGPGTYSVMTMIAAEYLGLPIERVKFELGKSSMPKAPAQGGSWTVSSVGTAVHGAAGDIRKKLLELARKLPDSPFKTATEPETEVADGELRLKADAGKREAFSDILKKTNTPELSSTFDSDPSQQRDKFATYAHGAQYVEVKVDPDLGAVRVTRVIEATACGKIMNPKTSHSQEIGGVVWGIGMALMEETQIDHRYGRMMNRNLAEYHVPVHADVHEIETLFVEEEDKIVNPLGVKGMGELGLVGIPAAIANAVFHATGKRIRQLPITPDKLIG